MDKAKKPFSTSEVKQLMIQFLSAVDHMHDKWYIHRDLKTTNLLYQNGVLCLCDFGLARKYGRCRIFLKRISCSYSTHYCHMQLNNTSCSYFAVSFYFIVNGATLTLLLAPPSLRSQSHRPLHIRSGHPLV